MNAGGAETFLMKIFRSIDRTKFQMDFCVAITYRGVYDDEIESSGGIIYHIPPKTKNPFSSFDAIKKIVKENNYSSVLRISQNSISCIDLMAAKLGGAKILAFRSSNSGTCGGKLQDIMHEVFKPVLNSVSNVKIAPSICAANFMFGKKVVNKNEVNILNNGLDIELFKFNENIRESYRKSLGIENKYVVGHVGRFNEQKNHEFIIKMFGELVKIKPESHLILVGDGEKRTEIEQLCDKLSIKNHVSFLGIRSDIPMIMMAMDVFVLPSFFEGMPNVAIEAQTTGLRCLLADTITLEAKVSDLVQYLPISDFKIWVNFILSHNMTSLNRGEYASIMQKSGYSIDDVSRKFVEILYK
jgi:glycosyltransferase involved in cell wall biosynthesis